MSLDTGAGEYCLADLAVEAIPSSIYVDPMATDLIVDPTKVAQAEFKLGPFYKVTKNHGRSVEDPNGILIRQIPVTDENGHLYVDYSIKGAETLSPDISHSPIEPLGIRVNGLMEASLFDRVRLVSQYLRAAGVLTEWPIYNAIPTRYYDEDPDEPGLDLNEMRECIWEQHIEMLTEVRKRNISRGLNVSVGKVGLLGQALSESEWGVMYRAMMSNVRLGDLRLLKLSDEDKEAYETMEFIRSERIRSAISVLQTRDIGNDEIQEKIRKLDPENTADQLFYIKNLLPEIIGMNLARLHNLGCTHGYPHGNNWTIAGELVDNDTVLCPAVFSEDAEYINSVSYYVDISRTLDDVPTVISTYLRSLNPAEVAQIAITGDEKTQLEFYIANKVLTGYNIERLKAERPDDLHIKLIDSEYGYFTGRIKGVNQLGDESGRPTLFQSVEAQEQVIAKMSEYLEKEGEGATYSGLRQETSHEVYRLLKVLLSDYLTYDALNGLSMYRLVMVETLKLIHQLLPKESI